MIPAKLILLTRKTFDQQQGPFTAVNHSAKPRNIEILVSAWTRVVSSQGLGVVVVKGLDCIVCSRRTGTEAEAVLIHTPHLPHLMHT